MLLLSRIIAVQWFRSLFGSLTILFILITVGDIVNGLLANDSLKSILIEYLLKLPELMGKALPIASLLSTLFTINHLKSQSELLAILASGYNSRRIYILIFFCSLFVGFIQFINLGYIQPTTNHYKRNQIEKGQSKTSKFIARSKVGESKLIWYKTDSYFMSFSSFIESKNQLQNVSLFYFNNDNKLARVIRAPSANYLNNTWSLLNAVSIDHIDQNDFQAFNSFDILDTKISQTPDDFSQFESDLTTLGFFTFYRFIKNLSSSGIDTSEYFIMLFEKLSLSIICILFSLMPLGAIFSPNRRSGSFGKNIVFTLVFSVVFWLVYSSVISMGIAGKISPFMSVFSIPFFFSLIIIFTYLKNVKL